MKKIIFDVETTGLNACENQIAQLSYIIIDEEFNIEKAKNFYFTVDYMEPRASSVNGLTEKILEKLSNNKKFKDFAEEIYTDFLDVEVLIAHNLDFDLRFLIKEFKRLGFDIDKLGENKGYFCTMESYTMFMEIPHDYYGLKYPRLDEVMCYLDIKYTDIEDKENEVFGCDVVSWHDSQFDVIATLEAYKQVKNIQKIMFCKDIYSMFNIVEKRLNTIKSRYIRENDINVDEAYNLLVGNNTNHDIKKSLKNLSSRIERIRQVIEKEEEKDFK